MKGPVKRPKAFRIPWPREHGGWGMIATPLLLGWLGSEATAVPGGFWPGLFFGAAALIFYLTHEPIDQALFARDPALRRVMWRWTFGLATCGLILLIPVVAGRPVIPAAAGAASAALGIMMLVLWRQRHGHRRDLLTRALAPVGMSLAAPLTEWAVRGGITSAGWTLAVFDSLFFLGSLLRVRSLVGERGRLGFRIISAAGNLAIVLGVMRWPAVGFEPRAWIIFLPGLILSLAYLLHVPSGHSPLKIGMIELGANVLFLIGLIKKH